MMNKMNKNWRPSPTDIVITTGAVVNLLVITAILVYYFFGR